ncbi:MAG: hypothetical protein GX660_02320, partial [Clostridiaceae bacterium]|nr:hypothetical protein [Clostridiaceae bacterium]
MACSCCKKAIDDNSGCDIHKEDKATCDNLNDSSLFKAMENTDLCLDVVFDWACEIYAHHIAVDGR